MDQQFMALCDEVYYAACCGDDTLRPYPWLAILEPSPAAATTIVIGHATQSACGYSASFVTLERGSRGVSAAAADGGL